MQPSFTACTQRPRPWVGGLKRAWDGRLGEPLLLTCTSSDPFRVELSRVHSATKCASPLRDRVDESAYCSASGDT